MEGSKHRSTTRRQEMEEGEGREEVRSDVLEKHEKARNIGNDPFVMFKLRIESRI